MTTRTQDEIAIGRFARVCGFGDDPGHVEAFSKFAGRLRLLPESARKLLVHITELAFREHHDGRKPGAAYLPELHETCGVGVDEMYELLKQLEQSGFVRIEGEYPFQDVALQHVGVARTEWPLMQDLWRFCKLEQISLRDVLVDLKFDFLA